MADVTRLLQALESYSRQVHSHRRQVSGVFTDMSAAVKQLQSHYEGQAAREFLGHWQHTLRAFDSYISGMDSVGSLLDERVEHLRQADRPEG
jgi:WXG100 family type VII secretion target